MKDTNTSLFPFIVFLHMSFKVFLNASTRRKRLISSPSQPLSSCLLLGASKSFFFFFSESQIQGAQISLSFSHLIQSPTSSLGSLNIYGQHMQIWNSTSTPSRQKLFTSHLLAGVLKEEHVFYSFFLCLLQALELVNTICSLDPQIQGR